MAAEEQFRPLIAVVRRSPDEAILEVTLDHDGWVVDGLAEVADGDLTDAAGRATCMAVNALLTSRAEVRLERIAHLPSSSVTKEVVLAAVRLVLDGEPAAEQLLGAAFVRHDVQVAAVRATLDALTRRLAPHVSR